MKYALISDIHEDVINLKLALKMIEKEACDEIICLGDIMGFNKNYYEHGATKNATECLSIIRSSCSKVIVGNHDLHALKKIPQFTKGFNFPENWYGLGMDEREKHANNQVWLYNDGEQESTFIEHDKEWLESLPELDFINLGEYSIMLSHYIHPNTSGSLRGFYYDGFEFEAHKKLMEENNCVLSFAGHMHCSGLYISSRRIKTKRFNRTYKIKYGDSILIPPIVDSKNGSGFCIFDTNRLTVTAKRF